MIKRIKFDLYDLASEMLDHFPEDKFQRDDTVFLDPSMGGGQFVHALEDRLRAYGHSDENIRKRIFGFGSVLMDIRYSVNKRTLIGQYSVVSPTTYTETDTLGMKFDGILGNPPFQNTHGVNSHALWEDFINKSHGLVKDDGIVAMVTPHIGRRKVKRHFFENDLLVYRGKGVKDYFPGVGSTFCYHIVRKGKTNQVPVFDGVSWDLEATGIDLIPGEVTPEVIKLLERLTTGTPLNIQGGGVHSSKKDLFSDKESKSFPHRYQHTSSQTKFCKVECPAMEHKLKVICSKSGYLKPWLDTDHTGITESSWCVPVSSKAEGKRVIDFLTSDDVKKFNDVTGSNSGAHDPNKYKLLCMS